MTLLAYVCTGARLSVFTGCMISREQAKDIERHVVALECVAESNEASRSCGSFEGLG